MLMSKSKNLGGDLACGYSLRKTVGLGLVILDFKNDTPLMILCIRP